MDRSYAALPGRVGTYFNSPYSRQIADNLSTAIYGDPRDELTRERIKTVQAERARQVEADAIAADDRARERASSDALAAALLEASAESDPEQRNRMMAGAAGEYLRGGGDLASAMGLLPYTMTQTSQRDDASRAHDIDVLGLEQRHDIGMQERNAMSDVVRQILSDDAALERTLVTQAGGVLRSGYAQGIDRPSLGDELFPGTYDAQALPGTPAQGGGAGGGGLDPGDHENLATVVGWLADQRGMDTGEAQAAVLQALAQDPNRDVTAALALVFPEAAEAERKDGLLSKIWNTIRGTGSAPTGQPEVRRYDANGNRIQ
jgi:hypothetical protein